MKDEHVENNILIAKFMGAYICEEYTDSALLDFGREKGSPKPMGDRYVSSGSLEYHLSWDWLMPVVEKIESLGFWVNIKKNHVSVARDNLSSKESQMIHSEFGDQTKIQRCYICVVEFIKFYNYKNKKS